jgi:DNA (cytosine-5)-methyltransferase 1
MNELALFSGAGGGILGGQLMGWRTVCAVECDAYAEQDLAQRQNDRALPAFPIWSDVRNFKGKPWRSIVDVVSGGFSCQNISIRAEEPALRGVGQAIRNSSPHSYHALIVTFSPADVGVPKQSRPH